MDTIDPKMLDFANHRADATVEDIRELCEAVLQYGFNSAFVNPVHVKLAKSCVGENAKVGTVVSFPLGQDIKDVKIHAIRECIQDGADELDIVPDISRIKEGKADLFEQELVDLTASARSMRKTIVIKFIIETGLFLPEQFLSVSEDPEIRLGKQCVQEAAETIQRSGADFVKICSGMAKRGVSVDDVTFIRSIVGPTMKIKGAGGIDTKQEVLALIQAGANRFGTSHAPEIMDEI
jgi:deoxyribose-phosphate aldolase